MDLNQIADQRQSIRSYEGRSVDNALVEQLIETAIKAPSWKNRQTARFHVLVSPTKVEAFKQDCLPEFNRNNVKDAPVLIVCSYISGLAGFEEGVARTNRGDGWGMYDLGLQCAYLLLKASELGLDTLIMGLNYEEKIHEMLEIDDNEKVASVIAVGYRASTPERRTRKKVTEIAKFY